LERASKRKRERMNKGAFFSKEEIAEAMNMLTVIGSIQSKRSFIKRLIVYKPRWTSIGSDEARPR
jgi:hypothetical protein